MPISQSLLQKVSETEKLLCRKLKHPLADPAYIMMHDILSFADLGLDVDLDEREIEAQCDRLLKKYASAPDRLEKFAAGMAVMETLDDPELSKRLEARPELTGRILNKSKENVLKRLKTEQNPVQTDGKSNVLPFFPKAKK